jgi:hypothetical protein
MNVIKLMTFITAVNADFAPAPVEAAVSLP